MRHRNTETQRHRETETQTQRVTETQRHRETEKQRNRETETQRHRNTETQKHRNTETQRHIIRDQVRDSNQDFRNFLNKAERGHPENRVVQLNPKKTDIKGYSRFNFSEFQV